MTSWATRESVTDMRRSGGLPNRRVRFQAPFDDQLVERTPAARAGNACCITGDNVSSIPTYNYKRYGN